MPLLVLDANVLFDSPMLTSPEWESLIENRMAWDLQIVIPDVVLMETGTIVKREWAKTRDLVTSLRVGGLGLKPDTAQLAAAIQSKIDGFEDAFFNRIESAGIVIGPAPAVDHLGIARRASLGRAPYSGKDKDGYRDTLIWLTLISVAAESTEDEIWFVSSNTQDFGPPAGDWTGPKSGTRDSCPILFHKHLREELESQGLQDRIHYVASLKGIEQHLRALHVPIAVSEQAILLSTIDYAGLSRNLRNQAVERYVDPEMIALDPSTRGSAVLEVRTDDTSWEFSEAAKRGEDSWTANFSVLADTDLELILPSGLSTTETKRLKIAGDVVFSRPANLVSLTIAGIETLSDDLNRLLWDDNKSHVTRIRKTMNSNALATDEIARLQWLERLSNPIPGSHNYLRWNELAGDGGRIQEALRDPIARATDSTNRLQEALRDPIARATDSTNRMQELLENQASDSTKKLAHESASRNTGGPDGDSAGEGTKASDDGGSSAGS